MTKRRPNGDGMIRKRTDGRWEGRIVVGHKDDGKPIYKAVLAKTQKELIPKLNQLKETYTGVELTENSRMTLGEWLDKWLNEYKTPVLRASTVHSYRNHIEHHIKPHLGDKVITQITTADVQKMYNTVKSNGRIRDGQSLSDSMVRSMHMILHEAMEDAVRENLIPQNPTNGTTIPKKNYKEKNVLTEAQIEKLMDVLQDDPYWHDFFYTELMPGMRRGEICGLRWEDFDESSRTLHVQRTIRYDHGKLHIGETKTNEGNRKIILPQSVAEILSNKKKYALTEWIFPNPLKPEEPLHPESAYGKLQRTLVQAELPQVSFHELRHTFSTQAIQYGMDVKTLAATIGHASVETTLNIYSHVKDEMQRNAAQKIDRAFGNRVPAQDEVQQDTDMDTPVNPKPTHPRFEPYKGIRRKPGTGCI